MNLYDQFKAVYHLNMIYLFYEILVFHFSLVKYQFDTQNIFFRIIEKPDEIVYSFSEMQINDLIN